jgi:hypothetical protein
MNTVLLVLITKLKRILYGLEKQYIQSIVLRYYKKLNTSKIKNSRG